LTPSYQEEVKKLLKIGQELPISQQILKILASLPNKKNITQNIVSELNFPSKPTLKKRTGLVQRELKKLVTIGLIKQSKTNKNINEYQLTKKGKNFLLNFNEFIPVDLKFPYLLFNEAILPAIQKWQQLNWKTPLNNSELTNTSILPVSVFLQALSAYDLIKIELKNGIDISETVLSISNKGKEFLTELIILLTPLTKLLENIR
jgi:predicted transcriptional regulator